MEWTTQDLTRKPHLLTSCRPEDIWCSGSACTRFYSMHSPDSCHCCCTQTSDVAAPWSFAGRNPERQNTRASTTVDTLGSSDKQELPRLMKDTNSAMLWIDLTPGFHAKKITNIYFYEEYCLCSIIHTKYSKRLEYSENKECSTTLEFTNRVCRSGPHTTINPTPITVSSYLMVIDRVRNSANPCVRDMSKSLRTCQMSVHGYPVDMSIFCNLQSLTGVTRRDAPSRHRSIQCISCWRAARCSWSRSRYPSVRAVVGR